MCFNDSDTNNYNAPLKFKYTFGQQLPNSDIIIIAGPKPESRSAKEVRKLEKNPREKALLEEKRKGWSHCFVVGKKDMREGDDKNEAGIAFQETTFLPLAPTKSLLMTYM